MREQDIIRHYFALAAGEGVRVGVGDDAAVLIPPQGELVMSTDTLNAGVHFFPDIPPVLLARKAAAVSLSDIAAMGGRALWLTAALTAPASTTTDWFAEFARGLKSSSEEYGYSVVGGDLTRGAALSVTTTVVGVCTAPPHTRGAAQAGDEVWVSGTLGGAAAALAVRLGQMDAAGVSAADLQAAERSLQDPAPRLQLAAALAGKVHAMMDISDGLLVSAATLAEHSGVAMVLDAAAVPAPACLRGVDAAARRQCQFCGGDDYELIWTAPPSSEAAEVAVQALSTADLPLTRIGRVVAGSGVQVTEGGAPIDLPGSGYSHDFS